MLQQRVGHALYAESFVLRRLPCTPWSFEHILLGEGCVFILAYIAPPHLLVFGRDLRQLLIACVQPDLDVIQTLQTVIIVVGDRCRAEVLGGACGQTAGMIDGDTLWDEDGVFEAPIQVFTPGHHVSLVISRKGVAIKYLFTFKLEFRLGNLC